MNKEILEKLISFNTVSNQSNLELINFAKNYFLGLGYKTTVIGEGSHVNIFAYKDCDKRIILSAHSDTVPPSDNWTKDPLSLTEDDGKYFGLGTVDMKSFIAIMFDLAKKYQHKNNLAFLLTFNEEVDFAGAELINEKIITPSDIVIIGEPTNCKAIFQTKGIASYKITFKGIGGHGSEPEKGISAIEQAAKFILIFKEKFMDISKTFSDDSFYNPLSSLNFGIINGGEALNKIAENTEVSFAIRTTKKSLVTDIDKLLYEIQKKSNIEIDIIKTLGCDIFKGSPRIKKLISDNMIPSQPGVSYATEATVYNKLTKNVVIFGPGDIKMAHKADEFIEIKQIEKYESMIHKFIENL